MEQKRILKSSSTNNKYQATFLPILQRAETDIKKLIMGAFFILSSKNELMHKIQGILNRVEKDLPKELKDREQYINALGVKANLMVQEFYDKQKVEFIGIATLIALNTAKIKPQTRTRAKTPKIETPKQLVQILSKPAETKKLQLDMWTEAKGTVRVQNYGKKLHQAVKKMTNTIITTVQSEHPISLWQKAEIDIRAANQMEMLDDLKEKGVELAYISSHPNCSKRCEKWQSKLVSLTEHATMSGMRVRKVDGEWVYSLIDIMSQVQYTKKEHKAYTNNIINGFNCRHHLIPYKPGVKPTQEYTAEQVKRQREIETRIREMEREIRRMKEELELELVTFGESSITERLKGEIEYYTRVYKHYCEKNGYAWYQYRITI